MASPAWPITLFFCYWGRLLDVGQNCGVLPVELEIHWIQRATIECPCNGFARRTKVCPPQGVGKQRGYICEHGRPRTMHLLVISLTRTGTTHGFAAETKLHLTTSEVTKISISTQSTTGSSKVYTLRVGDTGTNPRRYMLPCWLRSLALRKDSMDNPLRATDPVTVDAHRPQHPPFHVRHVRSGRRTARWVPL